MRGDFFVWTWGEGIMCIEGSLRAIDVGWGTHRVPAPPGWKIAPVWMWMCKKSPPHHPQKYTHCFPLPPPMWRERRKRDTHAPFSSSILHIRTPTLRDWAVSPGGSVARDGSRLEDGGICLQTLWTEHNRLVFHIRLNGPKTQELTISVWAEFSKLIFGFIIDVVLSLKVRSLIAPKVG